MHIINEVLHAEAPSVLGWNTFDIEKIKSKTRLVFKVLNNQGPKSLKDFVIKTSEITNRNLRGCNTSLQIPLPKTNSLEKIFS